MDEEKLSRKTEKNGKKPQKKPESYLDQENLPAEGKDIEAAELPEDSDSNLLDDLEAMDETEDFEEDATDFENIDIALDDSFPATEIEPETETVVEEKAVDFEVPPDDEEYSDMAQVPETTIDYAAIDQEPGSESKLQLEIEPPSLPGSSRGNTDINRSGQAALASAGEAEPEDLDAEEPVEPEEITPDEADSEAVLLEKIGEAVPFQLVITLGEKELDTVVLDQDLATIGRDGDCDVVIDNLGASRLHAQIERVGRFYLLRDINSKTGTFIRGKKIEEYSLNYGDEIFLAKHTLQFQKAQIRGRFSQALREKAAAQQGQAPGTRSIPRQQLMRTMAVDFRNLAQKQSGAPAYIMIMGMNRRYPITENVVFFGKSQECDFLTPGFMIGERHVLLAHERKGFYLYHLGFLRPPRVNDKPVMKTLLEDGDLVQIGETKFIFQLEEEQQ